MGVSNSNILAAFLVMAAQASAEPLPDALPSSPQFDFVLQCTSKQSDNETLKVFALSDGHTLFALYKYNQFDPSSSYSSSTRSFSDFAVSFDVPEHYSLLSTESLGMDSSSGCFFAARDKLAGDGGIVLDRSSLSLTVVQHCLDRTRATRFSDAFNRQSMTLRFSYSCVKATNDSSAANEYNGLLQGAETAMENKKLQREEEEKKALRDRQL